MDHKVDEQFEGPIRANREQVTKKWPKDTGVPAITLSMFVNEHSTVIARAKSLIHSASNDVVTIDTTQVPRCVAATLEQ